MDLALAAYFRFEPIRQRVHTLGAHAVQTARIFVGTLAELATSVKICENEFNGGDAKFRMRIDGNAATVVRNGNRAIDMDRNFDALAVARKVLID